MRISVVVKTGAKIEEVTEKGGVYRVKVEARPVEGEANEAVIRALSEYFKIPKSLISIKSGKNSKRKIIDISAIIR